MPKNARRLKYWEASSSNTGNKKMQIYYYIVFLIDNIHNLLQQSFIFNPNFLPPVREPYMVLNESIVVTAVGCI